MSCSKKLSKNAILSDTVHIVYKSYTMWLRQLNLNSNCNNYYHIALNQLHNLYIPQL